MRRSDQGTASIPSSGVDPRMNSRRPGQAESNEAMQKEAGTPSG